MGTTYARPLACCQVPSMGPWEFGARTTWSRGDPEREFQKRRGQIDGRRMNWEAWGPLALLTIHGDSIGAAARIQKRWGPGTPID